jgi:hypothetical protein
MMNLTERRLARLKRLKREIHEAYEDKDFDLVEELLEQHNLTVRHLKNSDKQKHRKLSELNPNDYEPNEF